MKSASVFQAVSYFIVHVFFTSNTLSHLTNAFRKKILHTL